MKLNQKLLKAFIKRLKDNGKNVAKADEIFQPVWEYMDNTERRSIGKEFYNEVVAGKISGVTLNRINGAGRPYYNI